MNGLDYVILGIISLGAIYGSARGILRIASSLIALIAAVYLASLHYGAAGAYLAREFSMRQETGAVLAYIAIFLAVIVVVTWGGSKLAELIHAVHMTWADRLGGAVVGAIVGVLLAGFMVVCVTAMLPVEAPLARQSQLAFHVLELNHELAGFVPVQIRNAYYYRESQFATYWNGHKATLPGLSSETAATP